MQYFVQDKKKKMYIEIKGLLMYNGKTAVSFEILRMTRISVRIETIEV